MMSPRSRWSFLALVFAQAAHSVEEYTFRLFDVFAPARFVSGLLGLDYSVGFAVANTALVAFGLWCYFARVRRSHPSGPVFAWCWAIIEFANGIAHIVLAIREAGYFPGAATAPVLLVVAAYLASTLATPTRPASSTVRR